MKRPVPRDPHLFHSRRCGTEFRGCAPDCPKDTYERTGEWTGPAWPVAGEIRQIPAPGAPGSFGARRKFDVHTGVDLYCAQGAAVFAVERGTVVAIEVFTGPNTVPPSPWWNETHAILVESRERVLCYGEVSPLVQIGDTVEPGQHIANVVRVLKTDKGRPMDMLHFEMYKHGTRATVWWKLDEQKPENLLDPTPLILGLLAVPDEEGSP